MTSWTTLPESPLIYSADVAQRAQVILDRLELADRDAGERGVLAVGGEQPRVVGPAGAEEAGPRAAARRAAGTAVPASTGRSSRSSDILHGVGEVLLAPVDALGEQRVAGQVQAGIAAEREPLRDLAPQSAGGSARAAACSARAAAGPSSEPATANHTVHSELPGTSMS